MLLWEKILKGKETRIDIRNIQVYGERSQGNNLDVPREIVKKQPVQEMTFIRRSRK